MIHDIPEIEPAYTTSCKYYHVGDAALTACFWLAFNKAIIAVSVCYGASIARRNVIVEYATIWWVVVLNLTSCCMIIALWCYYYLPLDLMKACLGISCAGKFLLSEIDNYLLYFSSFGILRHRAFPNRLPAEQLQKSPNQPVALSSRKHCRSNDCSSSKCRSRRQ